MNFFNAKKIIKVVAFGAIGLSFTFGVNAMRGADMFNYKCSEEYRCLDPNLKREIDIFHSHVMVIEIGMLKCNGTIAGYCKHAGFHEFLMEVDRFLSKFNSTDKASVVRVIGISNFDKGYIVNTCLLKNFTNICKSSINGEFLSLGYVTSGVPEYSAIIDEVLGTAFLNKMQWSVRVLDAVNTKTTNTNVMSNKHSNEIGKFNFVFDYSSIGDPFKYTDDNPSGDTFESYLCW